ncbi:hypothetical protein LTR36_006493 [Oleoguttula mirabilis]|uniref:Uncharacterized protein n=1 Tax=Oleoguttula mirabilis TaxID=1507867 RepID=A0AAV9JWM5_9PEZI|nr:hypothetical protein LTR36_006493 [Oleoguttula mirabilis]
MSENEDNSDPHDVSVEAHDMPGDNDIPRAHGKPETEEQAKAGLARMLNTAPDGPLGTDGGILLSLLGNPLGHVLSKVLTPVGYITGAVGRPNGEALLAVEKRMKEDYGYKKVDDPKGERLPGYERIGGNPQNGQNPLGL